MNASTLHVIGDQATSHQHSANDVCFSQFLYIDLRHEQGIECIRVSEEVSPRQRVLIEQHIAACGARKLIALNEAA